MQREKGHDCIGYCWSQPVSSGRGDLLAGAATCGRASAYASPAYPSRVLLSTLETRLFHQSYHAIEDASPAMMKKERDRVEQRHRSRLAELDD